MGTYFVADVHVGNHRRFGGAAEAGVNNRAREVLEVLAKASAIANETSESLVILGDLCDTARPSPQMLKAIGEVLTGDTLLLMGNHDRASMQEHDHALAPLSWIENVSVVAEPSNIGQLALVPFQTGPAKEWLIPVVRKLNPPKGRVLCIHLGIEDDNTPWFLKDSHDSIRVDVIRELIEEFSFSGVFAGNWHNRQTWEGPNGEPIVQSGALVPTGFDNSGLEGYGSLWHFDGKEARCSILPGPRYITAKTPESLKKLLGDAEEYIGAIVRAKYVTSAPTISEGRAEIAHLLSHAMLDAVVVEVDVEAMRVAAVNAAENVKSGVSLPELVATFVGDMNLGDIQQEVIEKVKGYLKG